MPDTKFRISEFNQSRKRKRWLYRKSGACRRLSTLPNQDGQNVSLSDHAGKHVVLWFYPRAFGNN